jgi:drug/metabolite transporter (DMT)-like permease
MHATSGHWKFGLWLALTTALLWGLLPIALTIVLEDMDAFSITWYRFSTAGLALGLYLAWRGRLPKISALTSRSWVLFAVALIGLCANYVLYPLALHRMNPTGAQVLIQLAPVFLLFGGVLVFRERLSALQWAGVFVFVTGLLLFFHDRLADIVSGEGQFGLGVLMMIGAALTWAVYGLAQKQLLNRLASEQVLLMLYLGAMLVLLPPAHPGTVAELSTLQLAMLGFCCLNTVVAYGCFAEALEHWEVSRVSAVVALAPLFTMLAMYVGSRIWPSLASMERLNVLNVVGALMVVTGSMTTALGSRSARQTVQSPVPGAGTIA